MVLGDFSFCLFFSLSKSKYKTRTKMKLSLVKDSAECLKHGSELSFKRLSLQIPHLHKPSNNDVF